MRTLLHRLTHRHVHYARDGFGIVRACSLRVPGASVRLLWWPEPDVPEAPPLEVPADRLNAWLDATTQLERLWALS